MPLNKLRLRTTVLISVFLAASVLVNGQDMKQDKPAEPKYKVGQKWSHDARPER